MAGDTLRIAMIDDRFQRWDELLALIRTSFQYMNGIIDPPSSALALTPQALRRKARAETGLVAYIGDDLVGCAFLADRGDRLYLGKLAIDPGRQRSGIGRRLVEAGEAEARALGRKAIELQARIELTGNQAAFARLGFHETERTAHAGFDRPTSITMVKELN